MIFLIWFLILFILSDVIFLLCCFNCFNNVFFLFCNCVNLLIIWLLDFIFSCDFIVLNFFWIFFKYKKVVLFVNVLIWCILVFVFDLFIILNKLILEVLWIWILLYNLIENGVIFIICIILLYFLLNNVIVFIFLVEVIFIFWMLMLIFF